MGEQVRGALERGAVVVTGNERTARTLRRAYDAEMAAGGRLRWEPAAVLSWSSWTGALWRRLLIGGRTRSLLLNAEQEHAVWRGVLAGDTESASLRGLDGLAEMAAESWARMWAYAEMSRSRSGRERLFGRLSDGSGGTDTAAFARWVRAFAERCQADRLLTGAELDAVLAGEVEAGELGVAEREIRLVGFDGLLPRQERLVAALGRAGVDVAHVEAGVAGAQVRLLGAADEGEELRACARWAARWLGTKGDVRIGVIVPDLQAERAGMERVFREVLAPELESILADEATAPFEFSLGRPLTETALSAVAMELLRWGAGALRVGRVSALLVSRYFAGGGEREARAEFDVADLRRAEMLRPELTLAEMARQVAGSRRSGRLPELLGAVRRMQRLAASFDGVAQSHGSWAGAMRELLAAGGWGAGGAGETSVEFQVRERWEGALDGLATLDFESRAVDYAEALGAMERIAHGTIFAPESRSAPVQVMGPLEAAGSEFDAVWLMRAGELSWPAEARPLPLLPWSLQRDLRMPGTDAERDLAAARAMTDRILASAGEVVVSYARATGETEQRASALVRSRVQGEAAIGDVAGGEPGREVVGMEWAEDAGRLRALPEGAVSGGVRVLELQAACGFRAFAEQRLGSGVIESQALGLSAKQSGTAVHRALESFWGEVRTQADLRAMTREQRGAALLRAIDAGLASSERRAGDRLEDFRMGPGVPGCAAGADAAAARGLAAGGDEAGAVCGFGEREAGSGCAGRSLAV